MSDELIVTEEEDKTKKKTDSRKFVVWLIWAILTAASIAISIVAMIVMKKLPETLIDLIKLVLEYFFFISLTYLGVNLGQNLGRSISSAISGKEDK